MKKNNKLDLVALNLQTLRKLRNITGDELAEAIGVTGSTIRKWESGVGDIKASYIPKICEVLEIDENELFSTTLYERIRLMLSNDEDHKNKVSILSDIARCLNDEQISILITIATALKNENR